MSLPTSSFLSTLSLLGFHNSILTSPFWQLRLPFPFLFTMEISAGFFSSASPHGSVLSHVASILCQWRVHLSWFLHPSSPIFQPLYPPREVSLPIWLSHGCCWTSEEPPEVLLQSLYSVCKHCSSFHPTLLLGLIKASPPPVQSDRVSSFATFSVSHSTPVCSLPFHLLYIHMGNIRNCPFLPMTNQKSILLLLPIFSPV